MLRRIFLVLFLTLMLSASAWAGIQPGTFSLSPMIGGHIFDKDQKFEDARSWSLAVGFNLTERATLEAVFSQTDADGESAADSDANIRTYRLDALYHFLPEQRLIPYFAVGMGGIVTDPDSGRNREHFLGDIGFGLKYFFTEAIALRADLRYLLDFPEPNNNLLYSAGLSFQFGTPDAAATPVAMEEPAPAVTPAIDSDGDGILDNEDKCPDTPRQAQVNSIGCPIDSDNDGIPDYRDDCPDTPSGATVNSKGCPVDTDGDGVYDYLDQCPETPAGVSVDEKGCPASLTLRINFGLDSDQVGPAYDSEIAKAAQCINNFPGDIVYIDGHTDNLGPAEYNLKLSERRALAVKNRLVDNFAIPAHRLTSRGFGESLPVADNDTDDGLFRNRRVEIACGAKK